MTNWLVVIGFVVALVGAFRLSVASTRRTLLDSPRDIAALCVVALALILATKYLTAGRLQSSARPQVPDEVAVLLDSAIETKVITTNEALWLNEWLNQHVRPRERNLQYEVANYKFEPPIATMKKLAIDGTKLDVNDRLTLVRFVAQSAMVGDSFEHGEYGETVERNEGTPIDDGICEILWAAANEKPLNDRQRLFIANWIDDSRTAFLSPARPVRDESGPWSVPNSDSDSDNAPAPSAPAPPAPKEAKSASKSTEVKIAR